MHGLIFVTWEKYLSERFGNVLLNAYRAAIGESVATSPLTSRVYDDATLLAGVGAACQLTGLPTDTVLREFGRYFILNGLTSHLCAYLLTQVQGGRDLLLVMSDAHAQMRRTPDAITPPLFKYEALFASPGALTLIYDSPRKLCAVLLGAIEGAAERYGEQVHVVECTCMKNGAEVCRFEMRFFPASSGPLQYETPQQLAQRREKRHLADLVLTILPDHDGVTLGDLQQILRRWLISPQQRRPSVLLEAVRHLQHVGLVASTANQPGDDLTHRRYWRAPTVEEEESSYTFSAAARAGSMYR